MNYIFCFAGIRWTSIFKAMYCMEYDDALLHLKDKVLYDYATKVGGIFDYIRNKRSWVYLDKRS